jgi:uncharacterized LabA/DUF88 family protein
VGLIEPKTKQCVAFIDAASLHRSLQLAFGTSWPAFHPQLLAKTICDREGWELTGTRLYAMIPREEQDVRWNKFWTRKLRTHERDGVVTFKAFFNAASRLCPIEDGNGNIKCMESHRVYGHEEIVARMSLDLVSQYYKNTFDVALLFSKEAALIQAIRDLRASAQKDEQWIKFASAVPYEASQGNHGYRGVDETDWIHFDRDLYSQCLDTNDYRQPLVQVA